MKAKFIFTFLFITTLCNAQTLTISDVNFKIKLLGANTSNTIAKNLSGNYFKIDANNDGEIQQSEADNVSELNLQPQVNGNYYYITSVVGIQNFNNLTKLYLMSNNIVNLSIVGMQHLTHIDCSGNSQYLVSLTIEDLPLLDTLICNAAGSNTFTPFYSLLNLPVLKTIRFNGCNFYNNTIDSLTSLENIYGESGFKNSNINLNLSNKPNLKIVELDSNSFASVTFLPNNTIETLKLFGSNLTSFDKTLFTNLNILDVSWNKLSGLDVSEMTTLTELYCDNASTSFTYDFTSLNVQGCTNLSKLICSRNVLPSLNLSNLTNLIYLDCYGNVDIFTNTGLQAISLTNCTSLKNVIVNGNYYLTELDLSCSSNYAQIITSQCDNLQRINLKNGVDESSMYVNVFNTSYTPNLTVIGVDFNESFPNAPPSVQQSPYYNFTPNCSYNTIIGNVRFDIEGDGCPNNTGVEGIKINFNCVIPDCYTFTDSQGNFILYTQSNSISITPQNDLYPLFDFGLTGPIIVNFTPDSIVEYVNLCLAPNTPHHDVEITVVPIELARPGFDADYKIIFKNKGNQVESGLINFTFDDAVMDLVTSNPTPTVSTNNLQWSYSNLLPFETRTYDLTFNINSPTETPSIIGGSLLTYTAVITGSPADENPDDNTSVLNQTVVNSYDPNNKICLEGQLVSQNVIGDYVHYIINFENNGTANAENIVVRDIINPSKFDISTLTPVASSHNASTRIINTNEVEFIFQNIDLPFNDADNDGYIVFKIKTRANLVVGDSFSNSAGIYFDYNYPIITNNFVSTITSLGLQYNESVNEITIYPNPVQDTLNFNTVYSVSKVDVYDVYGRILSSNPVSGNKLILTDLKTGNYFLKVYTDKAILTTKIIKE